MPRARLATFDCYGTLIDWEGGAASFLYDIALREGDPDPPNGRALRDRWEEIQFEFVSGPYMPYKQILAESLRRHGLLDHGSIDLTAAAAADLIVFCTPVDRIAGQALEHRIAIHRA